MRSSVITKLLTFILLFFLGNILLVAFLLPYLLANGVSIQELVDGFDIFAFEDIGFLRYVMLGQGIFLFIIPALLFGRFFYPKPMTREFGLQRLPTLALCGLATLFLIASYPLVNLSFIINQALPVSGWMEGMEEEASSLIERITHMENFGDYLYSLLIIAVLPAIGEELVFRGILQKQLYKAMSPIAAIWVASVIFSGFHLQFEGFLPRLVLGVVLGYVYYWTGNLWLPMLMHFVNNGIQVSALYFTDFDMSEMPGEGETSVTAISLILGVFLMYLAYEGIRRFRKTIHPPPIPTMMELKETSGTRGDTNT